MKKQIWFGLVFALLLSFVFYGCSNGSTDEKVIDAKYHFTGKWYDLNGGGSVGTFEVLKTKIVITPTTGAVITIKGVYTKGGGKFDDGFWAYLYDNSGKIGLIAIYDYDYFEIGLGFSECDGYTYGDMPVVVNDMKDIYQGKGRPGL